MGKSADDIGQSREVPETVTGGVVQTPAVSAPQDPDLPSTAPVEVPNHELIRCLGGGGFGQVWLAKHTLTDHYRACKLIVGSQSVELEGLKHLKQRVPAHPNLFQIEEVGEHQGWLYCLMPLADNAASRGAVLEPSGYQPLTLKLHVQRNGRLSSEELRQVAAELCEGLGHLHKNGITHGDVKPENVLRHGDHWTLADYGLLRDSSAAVSGGTPGYMPPEGPGGPAADQFALGVVMMQALTGWSATQLDTFRAKGINSLNLDRGAPAVHQIIIRATAPQAAERYGSMREMADALRAGSGSSAPYGRGALVGGLFVVGLLGIAYFAFDREATPEGQPVLARERTVERPTITAFDVLHFDGTSETPRGTIGRDSYRTRFGDFVTIHADFSAAAYAYLLALDANGGPPRLLHPCTPDGLPHALVDSAPSAISRVNYPPDTSFGYYLTDGHGVQAFALLISAKALPAYAEWSDAHNMPTWPAEQSEELVWRYDGQALAMLTGTRGEPRRRSKEPLHIETVYQWMRNLQGIDDVRFIAFPVEPAP